MRKMLREKLLDEAIRCCRRRQYDKARRVCMQILHDGPDDHEALHVMANVACQEGDIKAALRYIVRAIEIFPEDSRYHSDHGFLRKVIGDFSGAVGSYRQAISLSPCVAGYYVNLAAVMENLKDFQGSIAAYERALILDPANMGLYNNLGCVYFRCGFPGKAVGVFEKALMLNPACADMQMNIGRALFHIGRCHDAMKCMREAVYLAPDDIYACSNVLLYMLYMTDIAPESIVGEHVAWAKHYEAHVPKISSHKNLPDPVRRLRIGYVSGDLYTHAVVRFFSAHHQ